MRRGPICKQQPEPSFSFFSCEKKHHTVLAPVPRGYPDLTGSLPTCYSPVRRSFHKQTPRPAIAASTRPTSMYQPGRQRSSSAKIKLSIKSRSDQRSITIVDVYDLDSHQHESSFWLFCSVFKEQIPSLPTGL